MIGVRFCSVEFRVRGLRFYGTDGFTVSGAGRDSNVINSCPKLHMARVPTCIIARIIAQLRTDGVTASARLGCSTNMRTHPKRG